MEDPFEKKRPKLKETNISGEKEVSIPKKKKNDDFGGWIGKQVPTKKTRKQQVSEEEFDFEETKIN